MTLRNTAGDAVSFQVQLDRAALGLVGPLTVRSLLLGTPDISLGAQEGSFGISLPAGEVELLRLAP